MLTGLHAVLAVKIPEIVPDDDLTDQEPGAEDRRFNLVLVIAALFFMSIFIGLCLMDKSEYHYREDRGDGTSVELRKQAQD